MIIKQNVYGNHNFKKENINQEDIPVFKLDLVKNNISIADKYICPFSDVKHEMTIDQVLKEMPTYYSTGKNIILTSEGYGKSRNIINKFMSLNSAKNKTVIYSAHTIDNTYEKYLYAKNGKNSYTRNPVLIESSTELFRKIIKAQDVELYDFLKKSSNENLHSFLRFDLVSSDFKGEKIIYRSEHLKNKIRVNKTKVKNVASSFNSIVVEELIKTFLNRKGRKNYYIFYKLENQISDAEKSFNDEFDIKDFITQNKKKSIEYINSLLEHYGVKCVYISSDAIKNWRGFIIEKELGFLEIKNNPNQFIFVQNRVLENDLIPFLEKHNMLDNCLLIHDEITMDCFNQLDETNIDRLKSISKMLSNNGVDILTQDDIYFINSIGLGDELEKIKNKKIGSFDIKKASMFISKGKEAIVNYGDPYLCNRLKAFKDTIVLTTEMLPSILLQKSANYKLHYFVDKCYLENDLKIFRTSKKSPVHITKQNSENVSEFMYKIKNYETNKNETLILGTSYFNTDLTLEASKGRNFNDELKRVVIVTNPDPDYKFLRYKKFLSFFLNRDLTDNEDFEVDVLYRMDILNQTIGRVCGERRTRYFNVEMLLFINENDMVLSKALELIRYIGQEQTKEDLEHFVNHINTIHSKYENYYDNFISRCSMDFKGNELLKKHFNLDSIINRSGYTKKGFLKEYLPKIIFDIIKSFNEINAHFFDEIVLSKFNKTNCPIQNKRYSIALAAFTEKKSFYSMINSVLIGLSKNPQCLYETTDLIVEEKDIFSFMNFLKSNITMELIKNENKKYLKYFFESSEFLIPKYIYTTDGIKFLINRIYNKLVPHHREIVLRNYNINYFKPNNSNILKEMYTIDKNLNKILNISNIKDPVDRENAYKYHVNLTKKILFDLLLTPQNIKKLDKIFPYKTIEYSQKLYALIKNKNTELNTEENKQFLNDIFNIQSKRTQNRIIKLIHNIEILNGSTYFMEPGDNESQRPRDIRVTLSSLLSNGKLVQKTHELPSNIRDYEIINPFYNSNFFEFEFEDFTFDDLAVKWSSTREKIENIIDKCIDISYDDDNKIVSDISRFDEEPVVKDYYKLHNLKNSYSISNTLKKKTNLKVEEIDFHSYVDKIKNKFSFNDDVVNDILKNKSFLFANDVNILNHSVLRNDCVKRDEEITIHLRNNLIDKFKEIKNYNFYIKSFPSEKELIKV